MKATMVQAVLYPQKDMPAAYSLHVSYIYIPSFVEIGPLVPGKIFKGCLPYMGLVTSIMLIISISLYLKAYIQNVVINGSVVSEKVSFNFHM